MLRGGSVAGNWFGSGLMFERPQRLRWPRAIRALVFRHAGWYWERWQVCGFSCVIDDLSHPSSQAFVGDDMTAATGSADASLDKDPLINSGASGSSCEGEASARAVPEDLERSLSAFGLCYRDLYDSSRLSDLHQTFAEWLRSHSEDAVNAIKVLHQDEVDPVDLSNAIVTVAPHVGRFVGELFGVTEPIEKLADEINALDPLFDFRKNFVRKRVLTPKAGQAWGSDMEGAAVVARVAWASAPTKVSRDEDEEQYVAEATSWLHRIDEVARKAAKGGGVAWTDALSADAATLRHALEASDEARSTLEQEEKLSARSDAWVVDRVCAAVEAVLASRRQDRLDPAARWVSLHQPGKWQFERLVALRPRKDLPDSFEGEVEHRRSRLEPFALTDCRGSQREVAAQVDYCIYCHGRKKDSCSKGLRDKHGELRKNPLGVELPGCPLGEKISEMNVLRRSGEIVGALATAMIDNPMVPGTGHRICNDCMKGCIYQLQDPVNIPQIETRSLVDVLELPWGFEIYSLLSRWNPLNGKRPYQAPYNGRNVMVVGLGPAGYTLAHHLLNEGFGVVAVDGLKLEPLDAELTGEASGTPKPLRDVKTLYAPLEARTSLGFGGVSEYGITVRWDKNFLAVIYLNLLRNSHFRCYGGVRFGGTLDLQDAWDFGFDHVALAAGAGRPTHVPMKGSMLRGIRMASDFLMALQLSGAYRRDSLANLQVRLPAVVIGSGLTAIDTATELLAYYTVQVERVLDRYTTMGAVVGEEALRERFDEEELLIMDEMLAHGRELREERRAAAKEGREPRVQELVNSWGGVSVVYRRRMEDSPAYRLNHEEVEKSLEEGVRYVQLMSPVEAHEDGHGAVEAVTFERQQITDGKLRGTGEHVRIPAKTVCVAAGTRPNVTYEREYPGTFAQDERGYFKNFHATAEGGVVTLEPTTDGSGFFTSYAQDGRVVSYYGDNHPKYAGSVVKAMASAKDGFPFVSRLFEGKKVKDNPQERWTTLSTRLDQDLSARVHRIKRLAPSIIEVTVKAPMAARKFRPGQFYRLQNFEASARNYGGTAAVMEGLAMTGAWTDTEKGLLSMIVLEMGSSSRMVSMLEEGERVVVMGPTGAPTEIMAGQTVLLAGGGLGNAVLFSIAKAFKASGAQVLYFAGYRSGDSVFKMDEIERSTDQVIWTSDSGPEIEPRREQDTHFRGNIVQAMIAYGRGELGEQRVSMSQVNRIIAIGSDKMMAAVKEARHTTLREFLMPGHHAIGSINSPMQCMMKEICAQCLQRHVDPETGEETVVYSCFNQDQELDHVDFSHLASRLRQNSAQEKLGNMWFSELLKNVETADVA